MDSLPRKIHYLRLISPKTRSGPGCRSWLSYSLIKSIVIWCLGSSIMGCIVSGSRPSARRSRPPTGLNQVLIILCGSEARRLWADMDLPLISAFTSSGKLSLWACFNKWSSVAMALCCRHDSSRPVKRLVSNLNSSFQLLILEMSGWNLTRHAFPQNDCFFSSSRSSGAANSGRDGQELGCWWRNRGPWLQRWDLLNSNKVFP